MAERQLKFVLTGDDKSASSAMGKVGDAGESASSKIGAGFQKLGDKIGGEFGEVLNRIGEGLEQTGEHGMSLGKKMAITGGAIAGVGVLLQAAGSKEKQATDQLKASIDATGSSYSDYSEEIEKTVKHEENYAHSAVDTKTALQTLTQSTGDTQKALDAMGVVTDLAAARHISLAEAAGLVSKILGGGGAKTLAAYGVKMKENADGTKDVAGAIAELSAKLDGQANASMDNFGAKVDAAKVKVGDFIAEWGQKLGTTLTIAGTVLGVVSSAVEILGARAEKAAAKELALAAAEEEAGAAGAVAAAGAKGAAAGNDAVAASATRARGSTLAAAGGVAAMATAAYFLGEAIKGPMGRLTAGGDNMAHSFDNAGKASEAFTQALEQSGGVVDGNVKQIAALALQNGGLAAKADKAGVSLAQMTAGLTGNDEQFKNLIDTWKKGGKPSEDTIFALASLRLAFTNGQGDAKKYAAAIEAAGDPTEALAKAAKSAADQGHALGVRIDAVAKESLSATAQLNDMNNALDRLSNNSIDAEQQELKLKDALAGVTDQVKENGRAINDDTAKGRSNKEWILTQISAINSHVSAVGKQTGSVQKATAALGSDTNQLRAAAKAAGLNTAQVDALIKKYAATPKQVRTAILADTAAARKKIKDLQAQIDALRGKTVTIITESVSHSGGNTNAGKLAIRDSGGPVTKGTPYRIGLNHREEIFVPDSNGTVLPIPPGGGGRAGVGGDVYNINITVPYGGAAAGREIVQHLEQYPGTINIGQKVRGG